MKGIETRIHCHTPDCDGRKHETIILESFMPDDLRYFFCDKCLRTNIYMIKIKSIHIPVTVIDGALTAADQKAIDMKRNLGEN